MFQQPTLEKLEAMRLHGMAQGWRELSQSRQASDLTFEDRLALLVDRQFCWRQKEAFEARLRLATLRANACLDNIDYHAVRGLDMTLVRSLGAESSWVGRHENFRLRSDGGGEKLLGVCVGAEGASEWLLRVLCSRGGVVSRSGFTEAGRDFAKLSGAAGKDRRATG